MNKKQFMINGICFIANDVVEGFPIDPLLPDNFVHTRHQERPSSHSKFWFQPYVETRPARETAEIYERILADKGTESEHRESYELKRKFWMELGPGGVCYTVKCLDGEDSHSPSIFGDFVSIEEAVAQAKASQKWWKKYEGSTSYALV